MSMDRQLSAAISVVADASRIARGVQHDLAKVQRITKDDRSPVTVADFAVQAVVAMGLQEALGPSLIVGEEHTQALRTTEQKPVLESVVESIRGYRSRASAADVLAAIDSCNHDATADAYWTLDPVDGTKGFLRGQQYAIALALIERGQVVLGVMGCPNLPVDQSSPLGAADAGGCLYAATLGGGTWEHRLSDMTATARRIHAADSDGEHPIRACESVEAAHSQLDDSARVFREVNGSDPTGPPARLDSQAKYAVVARGQADVYLRMPTRKPYIENIWDHAAGAIIASEAGAVVSDILGARLDFTHGTRLENNRGIVCSTAALHGRIVDAIARLGLGAAV